MEAIMADSSESNSQQSTISSDSTGQIPRIEAIGISYNGQSCVSIAGQYFRQGDNINGFRILKIPSDKVEFERNGNIIAKTFSRTAAKL